MKISHFSIVSESSKASKQGKLTIAPEVKYTGIITKYVKGLCAKPLDPCT